MNVSFIFKKTHIITKQEINANYKQTLYYLLSVSTTESVKQDLNQN